MFSLVKTLNILRNPVNCRVISTSVVNPAARKGTREKARKKKVKVEVQKVGWIPHNLRDKGKLSLERANKHVDDSWKQTPTDNCYIGKYYRWTVFSIADAIKAHQETHHPTMYNAPNAPLQVTIELNMQGEKKTRFVENFQRIALIPHKFDHGEDRTVLVFAKSQDLVSEAVTAGATMAGGVELIKDVQNGKLQLADYQYILAHPNILADLVTLRGLMKKRFPNPKVGTLGADITEMVQRYLNGIQYSAKQDEFQKDFGLIQTTIGTLDMEPKQLEENLIYLLKDVDTMRPKRDGKFITRTLLTSPPSSECLKIDPFLHVQENYVKKGKTIEAEESDEEQEKAEAAN